MIPMASWLCDVACDGSGIGSIGGDEPRGVTYVLGTVERAYSMGDVKTASGLAVGVSSWVHCMLVCDDGA